MTTFNSGEYSAAADEPLDFDAFLQDASHDEEKYARYHAAMVDAQLNMAAAIIYHDIDVSEGSVTESIDDPERAQNFRDHVKEMVSMICAVEANAIYTGEVEIIEELKRQKKQLMASYIVTGCITQGDKWFKLLDELLPGDALDENNVDDTGYFIEAMKAYQQELDLRPLIQEIYDEIASTVRCHLQDIDPENIDEDTYRNLVSKFAQIMEYNTDDIPMQEAFIDSLAREEGMQPDYATQLKQLARKLSELAPVDEA